MVVKFAGMPTLDELDRIRQTYGFPESVLDSDPDAIGERMLYAGNDRRYPAGTKLAAYVSAIRFYEDAVRVGATDSNMAAHIEKAARAHDLMGALLEHVLPKLKKRADQLTESELPDSAFALVTKASGETLRLYPVHSTDHVAASVRMFAQDRHKLPYTMRKQAAKALLKSLNGAEVADDNLRLLERTAGNGVTTISKLSAAIKTRASELMLRPNRVADGKAMLKIANDFAKNQTTTRDICTRVAELLAGIDEVTGAHYKYADARLQLPEDLCHEVTVHDVNVDLDSVVKLSTGAVYERDDVAKIAEAVVLVLPETRQAICGFMASPSVERFAKWASTQDTAVANVIERVASNLGIARSELSGLL